jgi:predicted nucleic acid-binding protein
MKVFIDTNVIIDVLTNREPHVDRSAAFLKLCGTGVTGCITASQTTDIYYLLRRYGKDAVTARKIVKRLTDTVTVTDVTAKDVSAAFSLPMPDYEDALLAQCAKGTRADYLVTRNGKDFQASPVPALSPEEFVKKFFQL